MRNTPPARQCRLCTGGGVVHAGAPRAVAFKRIRRVGILKSGGKKLSGINAADARAKDEFVHVVIFTRVTPGPTSKETSRRIGTSSKRKTPNVSMLLKASTQTGDVGAHRAGCTVLAMGTLHGSLRAFVAHPHWHVKFSVKATVARGLLELGTCAMKSMYVRSWSAS